MARRLIVLLFLLGVATDAFVVKPSFSSSKRVSTSLEAKIGLFFGTSTGNTEDAAERISNEFGPDIITAPIDIDTIQGNVAAEFAKHDALIVCSPTWNTGADTERSGTGWDEIYYGEMVDLQIAGKKVAVVGLGDSVSYSENYADAAGELHDVFESLGCKMMGHVSQEGYEHEDSKSIRGDKFCGLLLDAVNQEDLTDERIRNWVAQLKEEGFLEGYGSDNVAVPAVATALPVAAAAPAVVESAIDAQVINGIGSSPSYDFSVIAKLEEENARLRSLLEAKSNLMDETIMEHSGFTPHFNPTTQRTMWVSSDGRKCYFSDTGSAAP